MQRIYCTEELHAFGGPGAFLLRPAEDAVKELAEAYAGKVQLIYLDPPFGTGDTFQLRLNAGGRAMILPAYADVRGEADYVDWMRGILAGCRALLAPTGSLYLHIDYRMNAKMRLLLDELFGASNFMNEIVWCYRSGGRSTRYFPRKHDTILFYRKSRKTYFDITAVGSPRGPEKRNHMKRFIDDAGRVCFSIRTGGKTYVYYEDTPSYPSDVWTDIEHLQQKDPERTGYATQKPLALLKRIILASSRPGDLVMDLFSGSGTTAAAAAMLGRRYLVADASPFALYTLRARQLAQAGTASLLDNAHAMLFSYPEDHAKAALACAVEEASARRSLRIEQAYFELQTPLIYAAAGTAEGNRFLPLSTAVCPTLPLSLPLPKKGAPVVQITDALGRQAFFLAE